MTLREAKAKAKRLTKAGIPTRIKRKAHGNYQTVNIATEQKWREKYRQSGGQLHANRRRMYGASEEDVIALIVRQGKRCPICKRKITARDALDHEWRTGDHRGVLHIKCNSPLGRTDKQLFEYAFNVMVYAGKRKQVLARKACVTFTVRARQSRARIIQILLSAA